VYVFIPHAATYIYQHERLKSNFFANTMLSFALSPCPFHVHIQIDIRGACFFIHERWLYTKWIPLLVFLLFPPAALLKDRQTPKKRHTLVLGEIIESRRLTRERESDIKTTSQDKVLFSRSLFEFEKG
jgi:hypothetical protein